MGITQIKIANSFAASQLWDDYKALCSMAERPDLYDEFYDDFHGYNDDTATQPWVTTNATAGTAAAVAGGAVELDSASTTADQGVQIQRAIPVHILSANKPLAFECEFSVVDGSENTQFFAGLSVVDTTIMASGAMSPTDYMGFKMDAASLAATPSVPILTARAASGTAVNLSTGFTLPVNAAGTAFLSTTTTRLGLIANGGLLTPYIDGVRKGAAFRIETTLPSVALTPSFVCQTEGTTDPIVNVDWVRCVSVKAYRGPTS